VESKEAVFTAYSAIFQKAHEGTNVKTSQIGLALIIVSGTSYI
jgi:hypothetical protein